MRILQNMWNSAGHQEISAVRDDQRTSYVGHNVLLSAPRGIGAYNILQIAVPYFVPFSPLCVLIV